MPPPSDVDLVNLSAEIYTNTSGWDYLDHGLDDGIFWALRKLDGCDVIVFRGSIVALDWWRDLRAIPLETRNIGTVHAGFHAGMEKMWSEAKTMLTQPVYVTGHSLGAARALILTGLMAADKCPPARVAVFGSPRPGDSDFAAKIRDVPKVLYRNGDNYGHDRVCDVPLPLFGKFNFCDPEILTPVSAPPPNEWIERFGLFSFHHISLYATAVAAKFAKEAA